MATGLLMSLQAATHGRLQQGMRFQNVRTQFLHERDKDDVAFATVLPNAASLQDDAWHFDPLGRRPAPRASRNGVGFPRIEIAAVPCGTGFMRSAYETISSHAGTQQSHQRATNRIPCGS